jgi:hypothetical protein
VACGHTYLYLDGTCLHGRGERLGLKVGGSENKDFWSAFIDSLKERGLKSSAVGQKIHGPGRQGFTMASDPEEITESQRRPQMVQHGRLSAREVGGVAQCMLPTGSLHVYLPRHDGSIGSGQVAIVRKVVIFCLCILDGQPACMSSSSIARSAVMSQLLRLLI